MKISKPVIIQNPVKDIKSKEKNIKNDNSFEKILNKTMGSEKSGHTIQKINPISEPMPVKFLNINEQSLD